MQGDVRDERTPVEAAGSAGSSGASSASAPSPASSLAGPMPAMRASKSTAFFLPAAAFGAGMAGGAGSSGAASARSILVQESVLLIRTLLASGTAPNVDGPLSGTAVRPGSLHTWMLELPADPLCHGVCVYRVCTRTHMPTSDSPALEPSMSVSRVSKSTAALLPFFFFGLAAAGSGCSCCSPAGSPAHQHTS